MSKKNNYSFQKVEKTRNLLITCYCLWKREFSSDKNAPIDQSNHGLGFSKETLH